MVDAEVGTPITAYETPPPVMICPPTLTVMAYDDVLLVGVAVNVNDDPPLLVVGLMLAAFEVDTVKSVATAVVGPEFDAAVMTQVMALPVRCGLPATHESVDAVVGAA
jgi:hypothetical protein